MTEDARAASLASMCGGCCGLSSGSLDHVLVELDLKPSLDERPQAVEIRGLLIGSPRLASGHLSLIQGS